jgi:hypothetical protein
MPKNKSAKKKLISERNLGGNQPFLRKDATSARRRESLKSAQIHQGVGITAAEAEVAREEILENDFASGRRGRSERSRDVEHL